MIRTRDKNRNYGITLIAIVITVVILLILASISIQLVINNGLFDHMNHATEEYDKAKADEDIEIAKMSASINEGYKIEKEKFIEELHKLGIEDKDIIEEGTNLKVNYKGYKYTVAISEENAIGVNVTLYDYVNQKDLGTTTAKVYETTELNETNVDIPTGYNLYSKHNSSVTNTKVIIENGVATESIYTLNLCKESEEGEILIENIEGLRNIELDLTDKYALDNDINLETIENWQPIGNGQTFTGELN